MPGGVFCETKKSQMGTKKVENMLKPKWPLQVNFYKKIIKGIYRTHFTGIGSLG